MNVTLEIRNADLAAALEGVDAALWQVRSNVQLAMGSEFQEAVWDNIGDSGLDRPVPWPPLSPKYARRVGRNHATLYVSGALKHSIKLDNSDPEGCLVFFDGSVPYGMVHQFGGGNNIPARPYFPVDESGEVMPRTRERVEAAALEELNRSLKHYS